MVSNQYMKVVILKNDSKLGMVGDIKNVSDGYAINFLFPQKLAAAATPVNIAIAAKLNKERAEKKGKPAAMAHSLSQKLAGQILNFKEKADQSGTFFASVTKERIASELKKKGIVVKSKKIKLSSPIKQAGSFDVPVAVSSGQVITIKVVAVND
ncbi:50S ribosomal protein L9 [Candidatus Falkowbacteria bacterium CG10_big_fil_rev_8_21_14_0_10_39_11]|uniref:Large ribosomal subunit protein bL9 n=1 Tax=Candidatus Falkowbacteria bacterium CG10_big_fil_rev_8_21_14_0_10_39_11 TaxID=1974565 RepID=A0A2H0V537_9BACT|nr:MAG: 50S ribosomal protein L9 [Candidatus Falkowbacteria bacterium CG10_big_fil_rev_8_21_14_0_10_39_11]